MSYPVTPNAPTPHTEELAIAALHTPVGVSFLAQGADSYVIDFGSVENFNDFITAVSECTAPETVISAILAKYQG